MRCPPQLHLIQVFKGDIIRDSVGDAAELFAPSEHGILKREDRLCASFQKILCASSGSALGPYVLAEYPASAYPAPSQLYAVSAIVTDAKCSRPD
jgi:hypothetical protein